MKDVKTMSTGELIESMRDEALTDVESGQVYDEFWSRPPFDYYEEKFEEANERIKELQKQVEEINTYSNLNAKLDLIIQHIGLMPKWEKKIEKSKKRGRPIET